MKTAGQYTSQDVNTEQSFALATSIIFNDFAYHLFDVRIVLQLNWSAGLWKMAWRFKLFESLYTNIYRPGEQERHWTYVDQAFWPCRTTCHTRLLRCWVPHQSDTLSILTLCRHRPVTVVQRLELKTITLCTGQRKRGAISDGSRCFDGAGVVTIQVSECAKTSWYMRTHSLPLGFWSASKTIPDQRTSHCHLVKATYTQKTELFWNKGSECGQCPSSTARILKSYWFWQLIRRF